MPDSGSQADTAKALRASGEDADAEGSATTETAVKKCRAIDPNAELEPPPLLEPNAEIEGPPLLESRGEIEDPTSLDVKSEILEGDAAASADAPISGEDAAAE
jgi:hypothetical protein